jgi:hypothetical protein
MKLRKRIRFAWRLWFQQTLSYRIWCMLKFGYDPGMQQTATWRICTVCSGTGKRSYDQCYSCGGGGKEWHDPTRIRTEQ